MNSHGTYLFVLPWDLQTIGGVNRVVCGLYEGIARKSNLQPRVLELSWNAKEPDESVDAQGRAITRFRIRSSVGTTGSLARDLFQYLAWLPLELLRIRSLVRRYDVRVVNTHYVGSTELTWVLAKATRIFRGKVVFSLHGLDIRTLANMGGFRRWLWRWVLRRADAIVACSVGLAQEVVLKFDLPEEHVVTIHNGINLADLPDLKAAHPPDHSKHAPRLLNFATFEHKKGHDVLLRAFSEVVKRYPAAHLTIMGRDSHARRSTEDLVDKLGLSTQVALHTDVPHRVALDALSHSDLFVLSSRNEAFAVALLEAGAMGKPVVATDVCGVPELIRDGDTGVLVPSDDPRALAQGILRMLEDPKLSAACARRLHHLVTTQFTHERSTSRYLELIE
jgi:glycosyltransferase involved in cell wall biosynthesis